MKRRTKAAFDEFLVAEIWQDGMSQEETYNAVEIKKTYFLRSFDCAAAGSNGIPADIAKLIADYPTKLATIRETLTSLLAAQG